MTLPVDPARYAAFLGAMAILAATPGPSNLGALYLVWLAYKAVKSGFAKEGGLGHIAVDTGRSAYWDSFLVQITNPKILLFFGAVLPPFLVFQKPLLPQFVLFAAATVILDVTATTAYGFGGAALSRRMAEPGFRRGFGIAVAAVLLAAAGLIFSRLV